MRGMSALLALLVLTAAQVPSKDNSDILKRLDPFVRAHRQVIPDRKNGWIALNKLPKPDRAPTVNGTMSVVEAHEVLKELQPQAANLARAIAISKMPLWQMPATGDPVADFPVMASARTYSKLLVIRGQARIVAGQRTLGVADLLAAMRLGVLMQGGAASVIGWLAGVAAEGMAIVGIDHSVSLPKFTAGMASTLLAAIPPTPGRDASVQNALRCDLEFNYLPLAALGFRRPNEALLGIAEPLAKAVEGLPVKSNLEDDAKQLSRGYSILLRNMDKPWSAQQSIDPFVADMQRGLPTGADDEKRVFTPAEVSRLRLDWKSLKNPVGRLFVSENLASMSGFARVSFKVRTEREITRSILALKIWSARHHGAYPATLHDLVTARIVKRDPWDRFADKPLRYDPKRLLIWSVGPNGKDDGGSGKPGRASDDDLDYVWRIDGR